MHKKIVLVSAIFAAAMAIMGSAYAQSDNGFYGRIGAGVSFVDTLEQGGTRGETDFPILVCLAIGCAPDRSVTTFDPGFLGSAAVGYDFGRWLRGEVEYRYASTPADETLFFEGHYDATRSFGDYPPEDFSLKSHFAFANIYLDFENDSRFTPYIGVGIGGAFFVNDARPRDQVFAYQGRAGVSVALGDDFSVDAEYLYTRTNELAFEKEYRQSQPKWQGLPFDDLAYRSSSALVSLRKQF